MRDRYAAYLNKVATKEDKVLFGEAVTCARNGALRSAYIMTWLSVAESFKRRFRDLAKQDHVAGKIIGEVEQKEAHRQSVDMLLLDRAREYGLISDGEHTRLQHMYELRCLFGHPYEDAPSQELLVAAMADAVDIVLSRPTKLRHGFIENQVQQITENPTYLDNIEQAVNRYARDMHAKVADNLHGYVLKSVLEALEPLAFNPAVQGLFQRGLWFVREYLLVDHAEHLKQWDVLASLTRHPRATAVAVADPVIWGYLSDHARAMAVGELIKHGKTQGECAKTLEELHGTGVMTKREATRFAEFLSEMDPSYLASAGFGLQYYSSNIIEKLKSHDWYVQNPAIDVLKNAGYQAIGRLPTDIQRELGRNVLQAADGNARHAISFLQAIGTDTDDWPPAFVKGVVEECFVNERGEIRFKTKQLRTALRSLSAVGNNAAEDILNDVAGRVEQGSVEDWPPDSDRTCVLKTIDELSGTVAQASINRLKGAIEELNIPEEAEW